MPFSQDASCVRAKHLVEEPCGNGQISDEIRVCDRPAGGDFTVSEKKSATGGEGVQLILSCVLTALRVGAPPRTAKMHRNQSVLAAGVSLMLS